MRIFLAGIMQGSHVGADLHDQDYRQRLIGLLTKHLPHVDIYDPLADHSDSLDYDDKLGRDVFLKHNRMCRDVDVVIAFIPEASMGTAIEMWEAHLNGKLVVTISPMLHNWVVRFCSTLVYPTLAEFESELKSGQLAQQLINQGTAT